MNNLISTSEYNAEQVAMQSIQYIVKHLRNDNDVNCGSQNVGHTDYRMFKLSTICIDTASQSPAPLSDRIVNHMLAELFPFLHNPRTQFLIFFL